MEFIAMARLYVGTYGVRATAERLFKTKTFRAYVFGFVMSVLFCGLLFMLMTPKAHAADKVPADKVPADKVPADKVPVDSTGQPQQEGVDAANRADTTGSEQGHQEPSHGLLHAAIIITLWIPLALLLHWLYKRGWFDRCLGGDQAPTHVEEDYHRRTVDMTVEMTSQNKNQFKQLFNEDGRFTNLMEKGNANEFKLASDGPDSSVDPSSFQNQNASGLKIEAGNDDLAEGEEADDYFDEGGGAQGGGARAGKKDRKKMIQRHGFVTKEGDLDMVHAASKAHLAAKTGQVEKKGEENINVNVKVGDGVTLGCKFGPGLIVTGIQADSAISEWNSSHPQDRIAEGAKVISINDITAPGDMLKLIRSKEAATLDLCFQMPNLKARNSLVD